MRTIFRLPDDLVPANNATVGVDWQVKQQPSTSSNQLGQWCRPVRLTVRGGIESSKAELFDYITA